MAGRRQGGWSIATVVIAMIVLIGLSAGSQSVLILILGVVVIGAIALAFGGSPPKRFSKDGQWFEHSLGDSSVDTTKWSLELLRKLEWRRFEEVCIAFFQAFGFRAKSTRFGADGGVDINLYAEGETSPSRLVQCKAWNAYPIGIKPIRELRGVMAEKGVARGVFVTTATFTGEARAFAASQNIVLIDGSELIGKISELPFEQQKALLVLATEGDFRTPTCPSCGVKMTARKSGKDGKPFWGCVNYPRCRQTFFGKANAPV